MSNIINELDIEANKIVDTRGIEVIAKAIIEVLFEESVNYDTTYHKIKADRTGNTIGCGCAYCLMLHKYTNLKKIRHRLNKRRFNDNINFIQISSTSINDDVLFAYYNDRIEELDLHIKELKHKKDILKSKLNL